MSALRELVATFKVDYDPKGVKQADKDLDGLRVEGRKAQSSVMGLGTALKGLALAFGIREIGRGFMSLVDAASDADETINVLNESFGDSVDEVKRFGKIVGDEVGRSEFQLREFAGTIGSVVTPMLRSMGDEATSTSAKISMDFAKLAVDLSSFFNKSEKQAIEALRSGLTGQSEPLLQFGVVALQQNVADFADMSVGDFGKLDQAQKVLIRYRFIMSQTSSAQGDAARTAQGWANVSRRVAGQLQGLAVVIGRKLLPVINGTVKGIGSLIKMIQTAGKHTQIFESIMLLAASAALVFGTRALWAGKAAIWAWIKAAIPAILLVAALILVAAAIEDIITGLNGGDSFFGDFLEWLTGTDDAAKLWAGTMEGMGAALFELFNGGGHWLDQFVEDWQNGFANILESALSFVGDMFSKVFTPIGNALARVSFGGMTGAGPTAAPVMPGANASIPMQSGGNSTSNSSNINVTVNSSSAGDSIRNVGRETLRSVRQALREDRRAVATGM